MATQQQTPTTLPNTNITNEEPRTSTPTQPAITASEETEDREKEDDPAEDNPQEVRSVLTLPSLVTSQDQVAAIVQMRSDIEACYSAKGISKPKPRFITKNLDAMITMVYAEKETHRNQLEMLQRNQENLQTMVAGLAASIQNLTSQPTPQGPTSQQGTAPNPRPRQMAQPGTLREGQQPPPQQIHPTASSSQPTRNPHPVPAPVPPGQSNQGQKKTKKKRKRRNAEPPLSTAITIAQPSTSKSLTYAETARARKQQPNNNTNQQNQGGPCRTKPQKTSPKRGKRKLPEELPTVFLRPITNDLTNNITRLTAALLSIENGIRIAHIRELPTKTVVIRTMTEEDKAAIINNSALK